MTRWLGVCVAMLSAGCSSQTVLVAGRVVEGSLSTAGVAGAHVELRDDAFALVSETDADEDGVFVLEAPERAPIHLVVSGDGLVPAAFPGESGDGPGFEIPDGQIFAFTDAQLATWRADFLGCPGAEAADGAIVGTAYIYAPNVDPSTYQIAPTAFSYVEDLDQTDKVEACYLDEAGAAYDADAELTGASGRFAIFGVAGGPWALTLARRADDTSVVGRTTVYVPDGGVVVREPGFVPLL